MTSYAFPPETIEELDRRLEFSYKTFGKPETWKEDREWQIELYGLKKENNAKRNN